jgi:hypothetical protein
VNSSLNINHNTSNYKYNSINDCPDETGAIISLIILIAFVIVFVIMLLNLLIAIFGYFFFFFLIFFFFLLNLFFFFSNVYDAMKDDQDKLWKLQRCSLISEYIHKPKLPTPFSLLIHLLSLIRLMLRPIRKNYTEITRKNTEIYKRLFYFFSKEYEKVDFGIFLRLLLSNFKKVFFVSYSNSCRR